MSNNNNNNAIPQPEHRIPLYDKDRPASPLAYIPQLSGFDTEKQISEVLKTIFPSEIDNYFMNLAKLYLAFAEQSKQFYSNQIKSEYTSNKISRLEPLRTSPDAMASEAQKMVDYLNKVIASGTLGSEEDIKKFITAQKEFNKLGYTQYEEGQILADYTDQATNNNEAAIEAAKQIDDLIKAMTTELQHMPSEDRLNNIRVRSSHVKDMEKTTYRKSGEEHLSETQNASLKMLIMCFARLRVTLYREIEKEVRHILKDYNDSFEVTDFRKSSNNAQALDLLTYCLNEVTIVFGQMVSRVRIHTDERVIKQNSAFSLIMDFISDYYSGEEISLEKFENLEAVTGETLHLYERFGMETTNILVALKENIENNHHRTKDVVHK